MWSDNVIWCTEVLPEKYYEYPLLWEQADSKMDSWFRMNQTPDSTNNSSNKICLPFNPAVKGGQEQKSEGINSDQVRLTRIIKKDNN